MEDQNIEDWESLFKEHQQVNNEQSVEVGVSQ